MSFLRQVVTLAGKGPGYLVKGSRQVIYRPCQNWLNLRDLAPAPSSSSSSSFFRPSEEARERRSSTSVSVMNHLARVIAIISHRQVPLRTPEAIVYVVSFCVNVSSIYFQNASREHRRSREYKTNTIKEKLPGKL